MQEWVQLCRKGQEGDMAGDVEIWANPFENLLRCEHCSALPWKPMHMAHHLVEEHLDIGDRVPQAVLTYVAERCYDWIGRKLRVRD